MPFLFLGMVVVSFYRVFLLGFWHRMIKGFVSTFNLISPSLFESSGGGVKPFIILDLMRPSPLESSKIVVGNELMNHQLATIIDYFL